MLAGLAVVKRTSALIATMRSPPQRIKAMHPVELVHPLPHRSTSLSAAAARNTKAHPDKTTTPQVRELAKCLCFVPLPLSVCESTPERRQLGDYNLIAFPLNNKQSSALERWIERRRT